MIPVKYSVKVRFLIFGALLTLSACAPEKEMFTPENPLGSGDQINRYLNNDRLMTRSKISSLPEFASMVPAAASMYQYRISEENIKNPDHSEDTAVVFINADGQTVAYAGRFRPIRRDSSRISRISRRMWGKLGGRQPEFGKILEGRLKLDELIRQAHFKSKGVHGIWTRDAGFETIYLIRE